MRQGYLHRALRSRHPRFNSAKEFARFVAIALEEWRNPGVVSVSSVLASAREYGTPIDSTPSPDSWAPDLVDHLTWIGPLLLKVGREAGLLQTRCWLEHDAGRVPQRELADRHDKSTSTISTWVREAREEAEDQLKMRGALRV